MEYPGQLPQSQLSQSDSNTSGVSPSPVMYSFCPLLSLQSGRPDSSLPTLPLPF